MTTVATGQVLLAGNPPAGLAASFAALHVVSSACAGSNDYAGPDSHSRLTRLPCCLPPTRQGVGILIWRFSKLNHPAHRCLGLRFATHLAMCHARLEVRMESLSPFLWGSCIPYSMPV